MTNKKSTPETEVVKGELVEEQTLSFIVEKQVSPTQAKALVSLATAKIPPEHIKTHPGKGGKVFSYVPHTLATRTLNDALGMSWDWEIVETQMYSDKSATALGRMTINWIDKEGRERKRVLQEAGAKEMMRDKKGAAVMPEAFVILSACSRALLRCMLRAFNYGIELYEDDEEAMTPGKAWAVLVTAGKKKNFTEEEVKQAIQKAGIEGADLVDKFETAWFVVNKMGKDG